MKQIDLNYDGKLQFSEFLVAGCNKRALFTAYNLDRCFKVIDKDGDSFVNVEDLRHFLGTAVPDDYIEKMLKAADENSDGILSMEEFTAIMMKIVNTAASGMY